MMPLDGLQHPSVVDAWTIYLAETDQARDAYDRACRDAIAAREQATQLAEHARRVQVHEAWERCNDAMLSAFRVYQDETAPARRARDYAIETAASQAALT